MPQQRHYIKAFTTDSERGNPAFVLHVDDIRRESEFMDQVRAARCSVAIVLESFDTSIYLMRIFYERGERETMTCGHATLAAAHTVLSEEKPDAFFQNTDDESLFVQFQEDLLKISQKNKIEVLDFNCNREELANTLGVSPEAVLETSPVQLLGFPGKEKLIIPVSYPTLLSLQMNPKAIQAFCEQYPKVTGLLPYAMNQVRNPHIRHFPPLQKEDPVCGVGAQALAFYLQSHGSPNTLFKVTAGPEKGGQGTVWVIMKGKQIILGGTAVPYSPEKRTKRLAKSS